MIVPTGSCLESLAKKMILSDIEPLCLSGLNALRNFPTVENHEFLQKISDKPATGEALKAAISDTRGQWEYYDKQASVQKLIEDLCTLVQWPQLQHDLFHAKTICVSLGKRGAEAKQAIPALLALAKHNHECLAHVATMAINAIELDLKAPSLNE